MQKLFKTITLASILALTGNAMANQVDEFSAAMNDLISPPKVQDNQGKLDDIKIPKITGGSGAFDLFMGGFRFINVVDCMNELQAKALLSPTVENFANYIKFMQEACKHMNHKFYHKFCLHEANTTKLDDVASYNLKLANQYQPIIYIQAGTDAKKVSLSHIPKNAYVVVKQSSDTKADKQIRDMKFVDGSSVTKSIDDSPCDDTVSAQCVVSKKVVQLAQSIYLAQSFSHGDEDIHNDKEIIDGSRIYALNLILSTEVPTIYRALQDTKHTAYQKAQLDLLVDIDKQLKKLNQSRSNSEINNGI